MSKAITGKSVRVTLNPQIPQHQNVETLNRIVANVLGRAGCPTCGRIAFLDVHFVGDPGPDLVKDGVISMETQGF